MLSGALLLVSFLSATIVNGYQLPFTTGKLNDANNEDQYWKLPNEIRRVAVIGAGPAGLVFTSTLVKEGFEVRLFERAPRPGGVWQYTDKLPIPVPMPNRPIETMAYIPDIPKVLPSSRIYQDGDDGLTVDWRIREHWAPSPAWRNMMTTLPHHLMTMPDSKYPENTPWKLNQMDVNRHIRQYASSVELNDSDDDHSNVTSYWTRVERVEKIPGTEKRWTVTLRKMTPLRDGTVEVNWWQEQFDAVILGKDSENDAAFVPPIPGLQEWASLLPNSIFHSRHYRRPEHYAGKNVLVVGGGFSGVGIANDLMGHAKTVTISTRPTSHSPVIRAIRSMFHSNVSFVPEIKHFINLPSNSLQNLQEASFVCANGTTLTGFDVIILSTGHRNSFPFLVGFHNSTIKGREEPETAIAPIITDGTHMRSLHWTGHYIDDPTLLFCNTIAYQGGATKYQALGTARVWSGTARLPSIPNMWKTYPGAANLLEELPFIGQTKTRLFVTWLNNEILEFGGSLVSPPPLNELMELFQYHVAKNYPQSFIDLYKPFFPADKPRREWDAYNGAELSNRVLSHQDLKDVHGCRHPEHWADFTLRW